MIRFVDIDLEIQSLTEAHTTLDEMLSTGWIIIGHAVFMDAIPVERYTLYSDANDTVYSLTEAGKAAAAAHTTQAKKIAITDGNVIPLTADTAS